MICPDTWKLEANNGSISYKINHFTEDFYERLKQKISSHYFNELISIVIPDTNVVPDKIGNIFADSDHYVLHNIRFSEFIQRTFVENFVAKGSLYGITMDTRIDVDDCIAITPCQHLYLSLNKEVFQSLGLEGTVSYHSRKVGDRYTIKLNLRNPDLRSGTKYYERVKNALSHELLSNKSLRICWTPPDSSICKSTIAKYFADRQYTVELIQTQVRHHQEYSLNFPLIDDNNCTKDVTMFATPHELVEYVGMLSLSCNLEQNAYLNSYSCFGNSKTVGSANITQWKGMFDCLSIMQLVDELRNYVSFRHNIPWVALYCHGFPHATLSFGLREHTFACNGDNSFVVLISPDMKCLWYEFFSCNKTKK